MATSERASGSEALERSLSELRAGDCSGVNTMKEVKRTRGRQGKQEYDHDYSRAKTAKRTKEPAKPKPQFRLGRIFLEEGEGPGLAIAVMDLKTPFTDCDSA